jgi:hypothetical protein
MGRLKNKSYYHFKIIQHETEKKKLNFFKTMDDAARFCNCSNRLLGYKLKNNNENKKGKLFNFFIFKCYEKIIYDERDASLVF